jgi:hypothetical protein
MVVQLTSEGNLQAETQPLVRYVLCIQG